MAGKGGSLSDKMLDTAWWETVEAMRHAMPPEGAQRQAAVRQRTKGGISLLDAACYDHRFDIATALVREFGFPVDDRDLEVGNTAMMQMCLGGGVVCRVP